MKKISIILFTLLLLFTSCSDDNAGKKEVKPEVKELSVLDTKVYYSDVENFEVNGKKQSGIKLADTGIYYTTDKKISDDYVYGTSDLSYSELYYGLINDIKSKDEKDLSKINPSHAIDIEGFYDAVTSATSLSGSHSENYPKNLNHVPAKLAGEPMIIDGVKNIESRIKKEAYIEAMVLKDAGIDYPIVDAINKFVLNDDYSSSEYRNNVFTIFKDGSYSRPENVKQGKDPIYMDTILLQNSEVDYYNEYSDYKIKTVFEGFSIKKDDDLYFEKYLDNVYAVIIESEDGRICPCVYYEDMWFNKEKFGEFAFALSNGDVESKGNAFINDRFAKFFDSEVLHSGNYRIKIKSKSYEDIYAKVFVKKKLPEENQIKIKDVTYDIDGVNVKIPTRELVSDYDIIDCEVKGVQKENYKFIKSSSRLNIKAPIGKYTFVIKSDKYQDIQSDFSIISNTTNDKMSIVNGSLVMASGTDSSILEYLRHIDTIKVYKKDKIEILAKVKNSDYTIINEIGEVIKDAKDQDGDLIFKDKGVYTLKIYSDGYKPFEVDYLVD